MTTHYVIDLFETGEVEPCMTANVTANSDFSASAQAIGMAEERFGPARYNAEIVARFPIAERKPTLIRRLAKRFGLL